jgi:hypothetical protein
MYVLIAGKETISDSESKGEAYIIIIYVLYGQFVRTFWWEKFGIGW